MKNIKLIEVPSEIGAGTRGASLGIDAIKIAALDFMSNFFIHFPSEKIPTENKLLYEQHTYNHKPQQQQNTQPHHTKIHTKQTQNNHLHNINL